MAPGLVVALHGSPHPGAAAVASALESALGERLPGVPVRTAWVDSRVRTLESVAGPGDVIVPAFLTAGYHVASDIPDAARGARVTGHVGPRVAQAVAGRVREAGGPGDAILLAAAGSGVPRRSSRSSGRQLGSAGCSASRCGSGICTAAGSTSRPWRLTWPSPGSRDVTVATFFVAPDATPRGSAACRWRGSRSRSERIRCSWTPSRTSIGTPLARPTSPGSTSGDAASWWPARGRLRPAASRNSSPRARTSWWWPRTRRGVRRWTPQLAAASVAVADVEGAWFVLAATSDASANALVAIAAEAGHTFCVRADCVGGSGLDAAIGHVAGVTVGVLSAQGRDPRRVAIRPATRRLPHRRLGRMARGGSSIMSVGSVVLVGGGRAIRTS